jgi:hypothetical protein
VGSAPLLVFAHGSGLEPTDYAALLGHVASWGVVAAAPERGRGLDLVAVAAALRRGDGDEVDLARILATDGPLVVGGHSRGTAEASRAALESEVTGAILLAGGGVTAAVAANPSPLLFVGGGNDGITDTWMRPNAAGASGPHQLVVVEDAGHLSFTRLCEDPGAVVLLTGDCAVSEVAEASARPVVAHSLVAFVRWRSGVDETPESLRADVLASFDTPVTVEGGFDGGS